MAAIFTKAKRKRAKLRLGISGPSGSGKTFSSLLIARGLGEKIAMIDTEHRSGELYDDITNYDVCTIEAPFTPDKYTEAIKTAESAGYGTIIIDSLSHAWAGEGGLLDLQGKIVDSGKGNSYTAWRFVTPKHNALVEAMLQSRCHIIATMRSKMAYALQQNGSKSEVVKVGMEPIQRDGMEYEFTICFNIAIDHTASASKDRTRLFDGQFFKITPETGTKLKTWLEGPESQAVTPAPVAEEKKAEPPKAEEPGLPNETTKEQPQTGKTEKVHIQPPAKKDDNPEERKSKIEALTKEIYNILKVCTTVEELKEKYNQVKLNFSELDEEAVKIINAYTSSLKKSIEVREKDAQKKKKAA